MDLLPIFQLTCKEFNVKYTTYPSWISIFRKHFEYVRSLNDPAVFHAPSSAAAAAPNKAMHNTPVADAGTDANTAIIHSTSNDHLKHE